MVELDDWCCYFASKEAVVRMHGKQYLCTGFQNRLIVIQKGVRVVGRNLNVVFFYLGICYLD